MHRNSESFQFYSVEGKTKLFCASRFAEGHNCLELTTSAVDYINSHFPQVSIEDEFYELPKDQLARFLASEDLVVDTEFQVIIVPINFCVFVKLCL